MFLEQTSRCRGVPYVDCKVRVELLAQFRGMGAHRWDAGDFLVGLIQIDEPNEVDNGRYCVLRRMVGVISEVVFFARLLIVR